MEGNIIEDCLYCGKQSNLTFQSQEHILPSFLGGQLKLDKGIVSDQANIFFSSMEEKFSQDPIISFLRSVYGPGKRGKTKPEDLFDLSGISPVLFKDEYGYFLGIIANGLHTYDIPQIRVSKNKIEIISSPYSKKYNNVNNVYQWLLKQDFSTLHFQRIISDKLKDQVIFGFLKSRVYYAADQILEKNQLLELQDLIKESYENNHLIRSRKIDLTKPVSNYVVSLYSEENNSIVLSKIAINYLCYLKGKEFVQSYCKEALEFIGDKNNWNSRIKSITINPPLLPNIVSNAHFIQLEVINNRILAIIGLYNSILYILDLGEFNFDESIELPVYICDFKNQKDYFIPLKEFISNSPPFLKLISN